MLFALPRVLAVIVGVVVLMRGGRYERLVVGFLIARGAIQIVEGLFWWPHGHPNGALRYLMLALPQAAVLVALLWLVSRHRTSWLRLLVGLQALHVAVYIVFLIRPDLFEPLKPVSYVLSLAKTGCLAWALLLRNAGPPAPVPGQAAFDANRASVARADETEDRP